MRFVVEVSVLPIVTLVTLIPSDDSFGAQSPPLTEQIASILRRYPDGGQILKVC